MKWSITSLALLCCTGLANGQAAPTLNQNSLVLHNGQVWTERVAFPNFHSATGNQAGDCLWKVIPSTTLMTGSGTLHLTGFETAIEDLDFNTPLDHPDVHIYEAKNVSGQGLVPDFSKPLAQLSLGATSLPQPTSGTATGVWLVNWSLGSRTPLPTSTPSLDRPLAVCLMANPGEAASQSDGALFPLTALENYTGAPQASFSGYWDAANSVLALADGSWQIPGATNPLPAGELWIELAFEEPIIQPWCSSAIGVATSTPVRDLGPGAVWSDLARGSGPSGLVGWRIESWQDASSSDQVWAFLLLNTSRPAMTFALPGMSGPMAIDLRDPNLALLVTMVGSRQVHKPTGFSSEFYDGIYATNALPMPRSPGLVGADLYVGAVMVDLTNIRVVGQTNTCAVHLR